MTRMEFSLSTMLLSLLVILTLKVREGYDPEVDRLRDILHGGKGIIASMEAREKERTGIRTLKIG